MECQHTRRKTISTHKWKAVKDVQWRQYQCSTCGHRWVIYQCLNTGKEVTPSRENGLLQKKPRNFTREQIKEILLDPRNDAEVARAYGAKIQSVWAIRVGKSYPYLWPEIKRRVVKERAKPSKRQEPKAQCSSCTNWYRNSCSFGFPDAGGSFAEECSLFSDT